MALNINCIEVIVEVGTSVGIVEQKDGKIIITVRPKGTQWPHGIQPIAGVNTVQEGYTRWVLGDEPPTLITVLNEKADEVTEAGPHNGSTQEDVR